MPTTRIPTLATALLLSLPLASQAQSANPRPALPQATELVSAAQLEQAARLREAALQQRLETLAATVTALQPAAEQMRSTAVSSMVVSIVTATTSVAGSFAGPDTPGLLPFASTLAGPGAPGLELAPGLPSALTPHAAFLPGGLAPLTTPGLPDLAALGSAPGAVTAVPEPASAGLLALGLAMLPWCRRRFGTA